MLAHRGFTGFPAGAVPENTLAAFRLALDAGATHLESDVHSTRDGVAVLVHDAEIAGVDGARTTVADVEWARLRTVDLGGGHVVPTLEQALVALPTARFNLDVKSSSAADPVVDVIRRLNCIDRVLITSFSQRRRVSVVRRLDGVATSASALPFVAALLAAKIGATPIVRFALRGIDALQIPERAAGMTCTTPRTLRALRSFGGEIHIWTINDPAAMKRLFAAGVDGVVTDRSDLAAKIAADYT